MIEMTTILATLARERRIFTSEADLRNALADHIQATTAHERVWKKHKPFHLKEKPFQKAFVDLWIATPDGITAVELRYRTSTLSCNVHGIGYALKNHAAQDLTRYDFVKDVALLEQVAKTMSRVTGYAILLTNDSTYWTPSARTWTVDSAFRIHEGSVLTGTLAWKDHASAGTTHGREKPHVLKDTYRPAWHDYSSLPGNNGRFRYVLVRVA